MVWQCANAIKYGRQKVNNAGMTVGCNFKTIHETILQERFSKVLGTIVKEKETIKQQLKSVLKSVVEDVNDHTEEVNRLQEEIKRGFLCVK